jgi:glycosyltransferase involved in cell wall biosynthesis
MIKIAYVVGGLPFGGVENWLFDVALRMKNSKTYTCKIFNISGTGLKMPEFYAAGLDVVNIGKKNSAASSHRLDTAFLLRKKLKKYSPDIIHTMHNSGDYFGRISSVGLDVPVLTHIHNTKKEKKISRRFSNKLLSYFTTAYISVSNAVNDVVDSDHNLFKRKKFVLHNGIDTSRLDFEPHNLCAMYGLSGKIIIGIGRYVEQKNFDGLIGALKILVESGKDVSLVLVGEGSKRDLYESMVSDLGLQGRVVLTGYRTDVGAFLRGSDILAMPSLFEGFGNVHLEAMYCGIPAVVSRVVPSLEVCSEASLVCDFSGESIASQISVLLEHPDLYQKLADAGRRIVDGYTIERCMDRLFSIYAKTLRERQA